MLVVSASGQELPNEFARCGFFIAGWAEHRYIGRMSAVEFITHIHTDEQGRAWIDDTNVKVIEVVKDWLAHGSSPEEMCLQHPHLSLAQVHAALAYYYDHQEEFDRAIARELEEWEVREAQFKDSPIRQKLRALGKLP